MLNKISFKCEHCGHSLFVSAESAGRKGRCPKCREAMIIPNDAQIINQEKKNSKNKSASDWYEKGHSLTLSGEYNKAIECYDKAIEIDNNFAEAYFGKGICYHQIGDKNNADINIKKAKKLGCKDAIEYLKITE
ncbi:MAG: tetratricopeptide repeat protein [Desulfobacterales bacterium]|nr:tetratricopeptide repeat protein [Desulfobacterales bacterium]